MNAAVVRSFDTPPAYESFAEPVPADEDEVSATVQAALRQVINACGTRSSAAAAAAAAIAAIAAAGAELANLIITEPLPL